MLTAKENMLETMRCGKPDRFVNQYEALSLVMHPYFMHAGGMATKGGGEVVNAWGVTTSYPENAPGPFPVHTPDKIVVKDIENWREYVHAPSLEFSEEEWAMAKAQMDALDGTKTLIAPFVAPGLFEQVHNLCSIDDALMYYITNPDEMHELIDYLTEWELKLAEGICKYLQPEALFHHDDWGSETNSFLSPAMFNEFFLEPYKKIYGYYHDHGVKYVIHHSDSFAANLVPSMIEMGINVWQGCMASNNVPELVKKYAGQITFMGAIDNKFVDFDGWTREDCARAARKAMDECGMMGFIPCITQGGPGSVYSGAYLALYEEIQKINAERFGCSVEAQTDAAVPINIMFG